MSDGREEREEREKRRELEEREDREDRIDSGMTPEAAPGPNLDVHANNTEDATDLSHLLEGHSMIVVFLLSTGRVAHFP
jgi:hypothetical protein